MRTHRTSAYVCTVYYRPECVPLAHWRAASIFTVYTFVFIGHLTVASSRATLSRYRSPGEGVGEGAAWSESCNVPNINDSKVINVNESRDSNK